MEVNWIPLFKSFFSKQCKWIQSGETVDNQKNLLGLAAHQYYYEKITIKKSLSLGRRGDAVTLFG